MGTSKSLQCGCQREERVIFNLYGDNWLDEEPIISNQQTPVRWSTSIDDFYTVIFHKRPFGFTFESSMALLNTTANGEIGDKKIFLHRVVHVTMLALENGIKRLSSIIEVNSNDCEFQRHGKVLQMLTKEELPCAIRFKRPSPFILNYQPLPGNEKESKKFSMIF